jgi:hypothetical protein
MFMYESPPSLSCSDAVKDWLNKEAYQRREVIESAQDHIQQALSGANQGEEE